jgi:hypothetical protein
LIFAAIDIGAALVAPFGTLTPTAELEASVVTAVLVVLTNILLAIFLCSFKIEIIVSTAHLVSMLSTISVLAGVRVDNDEVK